MIQVDGRSSGYISVDKVCVSFWVVVVRCVSEVNLGPWFVWAIAHKVEPGVAAAAQHKLPWEPIGFLIGAKETRLGDLHTR